MRAFLVLWLALFSVQTSGVVAVVAADDCVEFAVDEHTDTCPDICLRCVCCARMTVVPSLLAEPCASAVATAAPPTPVTPRVTTAHPPRILHVPKAA